MKKANKALLLVLCAILLVACSVMGTLAYLTSTAKVENTFTVGNVGITLQDADLTSNKLIPGSVYNLNPTVTVNEDSETCWLVVKVENGLGDAVTISQMAGWEAVTAEGNTIPGYYLYSNPVSANTAVSVFTSVTCNSNNTNATMLALTGAKIDITAYAIQAENVSKADVITFLSQHYTLN